MDTTSNIFPDLPGQNNSCCRISEIGARDHKQRAPTESILPTACAGPYENHMRKHCRRALSRPSLSKITRTNTASEHLLRTFARAIPAGASVPRSTIESRTGPASRPLAGPQWSGWPQPRRRPLCRPRRCRRLVSADGADSIVPLVGLYLAGALRQRVRHLGVPGAQRGPRPEHMPAFPRRDVASRLCDAQRPLRCAGLSCGGRRSARINALGVTRVACRG